VIERNKEAYYRALRRTQVTLENEKPDWIPWLRFFLVSLKRQKDHLASKIETHLSEAYRELSPEGVQILDYLSKHGRITTSEAHQLLGVPRPTVKLRLSTLAKEGFIVPRGKGRGSYYEKA